ncbi:hypothetical protein ACJIZ3_021333 [Penstemon smallii]|uniref:Endoglucanase n=1 Tax=Penstemon smallii TaxID=265156 RepID=A0ABD3SL46_9LAMI
MVKILSLFIFAWLLKQWYRYRATLLSKMEKFFMAGKGRQHTPTFKSNIQLVTNASFLMTIYSDYITYAGRSIKCSHANTTHDPRVTWWGYGNNYLRQVHCMASSIVPYKTYRMFVSCRGGYATQFSRNVSYPNLLTGAIVGGPDVYDNFDDQRANYEETEPAAYNNAPLLDILARLHAVELPSLKPIATNPKTTTKSDSHVFPAWINSLAAGKNIEFVYIRFASRAVVSVSSYTTV